MHVYDRFNCNLKYTGRCQRPQPASTLHKQIVIHQIKQPSSRYLDLDNKSLYSKQCKGYEGILLSQKKRPGLRRDSYFATVSRSDTPGRGRALKKWWEKFLTKTQLVPCSGYPPTCSSASYLKDTGMRLNLRIFLHWQSYWPGLYHSNKRFSCKLP